MTDKAPTPEEHPIFMKVRMLNEPLRSIFPGNIEEAQAWKRTTQRICLASRVMVMATTRIEFAWSAYIDAVPGVNHDDEEEEVLRHGTKLMEKVARVLFPAWKDIPYAD